MTPWNLRRLTFGGMYAGLSVTACMRTGTSLNHGTIAPPIVRDSNNESWFLSASAGGTFIRVTRRTATDRTCGLFLGATHVPVPFGYRVPPDALQRFEDQTFIDTLDARFVNASTQHGNLLHNVHSIENGVVSILRYYRIHVPTRTVNQQCSLVSGEEAGNFIASLAVNDVGHLYLSYSSVNQFHSILRQVRFAGKRAADGCDAFYREGGPAGDFEGGFEVFTSPTISTGNPPGAQVQYSAIHIDPSPEPGDWGEPDRQRGRGDVGDADLPGSDAVTGGQAKNSRAAD